MFLFQLLAHVLYLYSFSFTSKALYCHFVCAFEHMLDMFACVKYSEVLYGPFNPIQYTYILNVVLEHFLPKNINKM